MGRGYSATRSKSGRLTVQRKRERSMSLAALKENITKKNQEKPSADNEEEEHPVSTTAVGTKAPRSVSVTRRRSVSKVAAVSEGAEDDKSKKTKSRARSASLLSQKIKLLEEELNEELDASEDESETVSMPDVMTKYKSAGRALDEVLNALTDACVVGANSKTLCDEGDEKLSGLLKPLFSKVKDAEGNKISRGLSFPTTICVNEVLCNHSPFREEEGKVLQSNDVVKIHVGCQIDGYPVSAARTVVVAPSSEADGNKKVLSEGAQHAIAAARSALLGMIHSLRPNTLNAEITDFVARVGHHYDVQALEGVLSNRTKRWVPDGIDCIIGRRVIEKTPQQDVGECEVQENQVWNLDIAFTDSPNYRVFLSPEPTTLYRRTPEDFPVDPRVQQANHVLKEISENFFCFPFHYKHLSHPLQGRMGIRVLLQKGVVEPLPVLRVKPPYIAARFSATVAITSKRITVLCGLPPDTSMLLTSATALPEDLQEVISRPLDFATAAAQRREEEMKYSSVKKKARTES